MLQAMVWCVAAVTTRNTFKSGRGLFVSEAQRDHAMDLFSKQNVSTADALMLALRRSAAPCLAEHGQGGQAGQHRVGSPHIKTTV